MLKIALLDDEIIYLDQIRKITEDVMKTFGWRWELRTYSNTEKFLEDLREKDYFDIYLLDMELQGTTGLEIAKAIRKEFWEPAIIFITNYVEYAVEAFEVNTYRYIPKKSLNDKLKEAYKALGEKQQSKNEKVYTIITNTRVEKIVTKEIYYLKKEGKYVHIVHCRGNSLIRSTLQEVYSELEKIDKGEFLIIDRGFIVNICHVMSMDSQNVYMRSGDVLPVSKPRLQQVRHKLTEYLRRK